MIKSISFIVLIHFFQFNQLKISRQPGYLLFKVKPTIFFTVYVLGLILALSIMFNYRHTCFIQKHNRNTKLKGHFIIFLFIC